MQAVSGASSMANIIPFEAQKEIFRFCADKATGQVVLNFHKGILSNADSRNHIRCSTSCSKCGKSWYETAEGWTVHNAHAYCGGCGVGGIK